MDHPNSNERFWAMLAYALAFWFPIVAPLVIFLLWRSSRFVAFHALQAMFIPLGLMLLGTIATFLGGIGLGLLAIPIGIFAAVAGILGWCCKVVGAFRSFHGDWYRVPFVWSWAERIA
jgi:uncharacterized membrane protein